MTNRNKYSGPQFGMGVTDFNENTAILKQKGYKELTVSQLFERDLFHPKYHGNDKPGCCLVKKRREVVNMPNPENPPEFQHYLDIYTCIHCDKECLKSGWEIHWYGGTYSPDLD